MKYTWAAAIAAIGQCLIGQSLAAEYLAGIPTVPLVGETAGGKFSLEHIQCIVVHDLYASTVDNDGETTIPPTLFQFALTFAEDLSSVFGLHIPVTTGVTPRPGTLFVTLDRKGKYLNAAGKPTSEGYSLTTTQSGIVIRGASPLGAWWATRTVLQQAVISSQEESGSYGPATPSVPFGSSVDSPSWGLRGMMLDDGRHFYPADFLTDLCAYMSFFKQNTLHLHISDNLNVISKDPWEKQRQAYARFRLLSDDGAVAGLNNYANESYDRATFDHIQQSCAARGVTVLPEIESPGHSLVITQWKPEIALSSDRSQLNISHPETIPTMKTIWRTFLPWFHSKTVSIGADEYTGPRADYNTFVNAMDDFIGETSGKHISIWGTFPPEYTPNYTNIHQDVTIQHWRYKYDNPLFDLIKNNYSVVNSINDMYIVNKWSGGRYLNTVDLNNTFHGSPNGQPWRPNIFDRFNATNDPPASEARVLGAIVALWNDYGSNASVYSEAYYAWREGIPALADKQWGGNLTETEFPGLFAALHPAVPAQNLDRAIKSQGDTIVNYTLEDLGKAAPPHAGPLVVKDSSPNGYDAETDCKVETNGSTMAIAVNNGCSVHTPLTSKGRNYTLALSLKVDALADPTNATLLSGRDSVLVLTPNVTLLAGGNYYRLNLTVPLGTWFDLSVIARGNRTYASVDGKPEEEFLTRMGISYEYYHWAEMAIEAPLETIGGPASNWKGLFGGMSLTSTAPSH